MTNSNQPPTGRTPGRAHPAALVGFALLIAGLLAWAWLGDWRWALTGLAAFIVGAVASGRSANAAPLPPTDKATTAAVIAELQLWLDSANARIPAAVNAWEFKAKIAHLRGEDHPMMPKPGGQP